MKICYVGPVHPYRGGISQHGGCLVRALREEHEVEVLSWRAQYPRLLFKGAQPRPGRDGSFEGARYSLAWWNPLSWWLAGRRARRADVLVFAWVTAFHAVPLRVLLAAAGRTPSVVIVHNPLPHEPQPFDRRLTGMVLCRATRALVHAEKLKRDLGELFGLRRVTAVPFPSLLPIEPAPLPPRAPGAPLKLLFLGFVRHYKGLDIAIEAVALLKRRGEHVELTVAGDFWDPLPEWEARIQASGAAERIHLLPGYADDEQVQQLLHAHHALVAPYRSATQSAVVPLAFAAGRPVVATDVGGLSERVREHETGALAPPEDPAAFAAAILRVAHDLAALADGAGAATIGWERVARAVLEDAAGS